MYAELILKYHLLSRTAQSQSERGGQASQLKKKRSRGQRCRKLRVYLN